MGLVALEEEEENNVYVYKLLWRTSIYVWLGHCVVQHKLTEHCKSTIILKKFKKEEEEKSELSLYLPSANQEESYYHV